MLLSPGTAMALDLADDWAMDIDNPGVFGVRTGNPRDSLSPPPALDFLDQDDQEEMPLQKLIRHWINERHAPDILPIQAELLGGLLDHIRKQVREISRFSSMSGLSFAFQVNSLQPYIFSEQTQIPRKTSTSGSCWLRQRSRESNSSSDLTFGPGFSRSRQV